MPRVLTQSQINDTLSLAKKLLGKGGVEVDNSFSERMGAILKSPESKHFLIRLMDTAFRSKNYKRVSDYTIKLLDRAKGYKGLFSSFENILLALYKGPGKYFPNISIPAMLQQIRSVTGPVLFFVGDSKFNAQSRARKEQGVVLNVNLIGEALLGEEEAAQRMRNYKALLNQKEVDYISIKLSTVYSQINPLAHEHTVDECVEKISTLYDEVLKVYKETGDMKFINLDMEEYRDLSITIDAFKKTLSQPRFNNLRMGIVLQAYLPDSYDALLNLTEWARDRVSKGGAPIKIRIVKGANLEMEKTEASLEEWPVAPYEKKIYSDANFKKMLLYMLKEEHLKAVNVGVASHNIFDLAFALNIIKEKGLTKYVDFELLEGMANETVRALLEEKATILLYTPIVKRENYNSAIAYLVRRLDEGSQDGNFLKEGYGLAAGTAKWKELEKDFVESLEWIDKVSNEPKRQQNRAIQKPQPQTSFHNVPNTDWILPANRAWFDQVKKKWQNPTAAIGEVIPVVGDLKQKERKTIEQIGWSGTMPWKYELADQADYEEVIGSDSEWYDLSHSERATLLRKAAVEIEKVRGDLIAVAITELGKTIKEVDVEVSEAIDFANYYAQSVLELTQKEGFTIKAEGINLVLSPWNFPIAIPIGGVLASLAAGRRVILKPSTNAAACSYLIAQCLWRAGVPKSAFAFLPAEEETLDAFLTEGNTFEAVILTGGTSTAQFLLNRNPRLNLYAETGGKNSTIVSSLSDRDQAIKNVVQSAFGNAGQKCSATSLLILEKEVYRDERFKILLRDAAESKVHGDPWDYETEIGPLAVEINDKLQHSLDNTPDDQWLLKPRLEGNFIMSPGIKWGVTEDDYEYKNELFGPILSVMRARDLSHAVSLVNDVEYGLTSGIESLDRDEVDYWKDHVMAGNMYANRTTTGAIVQRQPFGGMKASCFGYGMKAGGANYVLQLANVIHNEESGNDYALSYKKAYDDHFSKEIDYARIRGQHNINRYLKPKKVCVLIDADVAFDDIAMVLKAVESLKVSVEVFALDGMDVSGGHSVNKLSSWTDLSDDINHDTVIRALNYDRLPDDFLKHCHQKAVHVYGQKPSIQGRIELLNYLNEQNVSINYHRYGNLLGEKPVESN